MSGISLIVPTFNGGEFLQDLLRAISGQTLYPDLEMLVVDSGSTDQTLYLLEKYKVQFVQIPQKQFNHGATRNLAIQHTQGDYIYILTQDALPGDPKFLETMIASLHKYDAAGVYARQVPREDSSPLVKRDVTNWVSGSDDRRVVQFLDWQRFLQQHPMQRYLSCVFDNVASLIRRDVWEKIPFPTVPFGEDLEWAFRALCNGHTIVYEPDAVVVHSHERSVNYAYKRTLVDHWRLYHLFGLRTIPTRSRLYSSILKTILNDYGVLLKQSQSSPEWWKNFRNVPYHAYLTALGQYQGAKMAAQGRELQQSKEV